MENHLEEFQKILEQQHTNAIGSVNKKLYDDIIETAEIAERIEDDKKFKELTTKLRERFKNENLNQVTDIFIYSQSFLSRNEDPVPMPSKLCISIGKLFTNKNLHYTASKVYNKDEIESGCALSFLGYLAMYEDHEPYVLNFIKDNFEGFSQNKKTECVFQLKEILPDNDIAKKIIKKSRITEYKLVYSTETDSTSRPVTFQLENIEHSPELSVEKPIPKSPWWKFW